MTPSQPQQSGPTHLRDGEMSAAPMTLPDRTGFDRTPDMTVTTTRLAASIRASRRTVRPAEISPRPDSTEERKGS